MVRCASLTSCIITGNSLRSAIVDGFYEISKNVLSARFVRDISSPAIVLYIILVRLKHKNITSNCKEIETSSKSVFRHKCHNLL